MIEARKAKGIAKPNDMVVKTIVTTELIDEIAKGNNITCYNVLTGFKWIAELIREKEGKENYVVGGEESYGLMIGDKVRDKDAVSAVALLCEMAAYEKNKGRSLFAKLIDLYVNTFFIKSILFQLLKREWMVQQQIADMMAGFRKYSPKDLQVLMLFNFSIMN
jgi:phosphoglucomutase